MPKFVNTFDKDKPATLYYVRFNVRGHKRYKIGITNCSIHYRFSFEDIEYRIIKFWRYKKGATAYKREQAILKEHARHRFKGKAFLKSGMSEVFGKDVLGLDNGPTVPRKMDHGRTQSARQVATKKPIRKKKVVKKKATSKRRKKPVVRKKTTRRKPNTPIVIVLGIILWTLVLPVLG